MRRNKVLTTLAAVSMSAMMAVSAAPAVTVMAANETTEETTTNVGIDAKYKVEQVYGNKPAFYVDGRKDDTWTITGKVGDVTHTADELAKYPAGTEVTNVTATKSGEEAQSLDNYQIQKATPSLSIDEYGNIIAPDEVKAAATVTLLKSNSREDIEKDYGPYTTDSKPATNGWYKYVVTSAETTNYKAVTTPQYSSPRYVDNFPEANLEATVHNSTFGENPVVSVPDWEDRTLTATIYPQVTKHELVNGKETTRTVDGNPISADIVKNGQLIVKSEDAKDPSFKSSIETIKFADGTTKKVLKAGTYNFYITAFAGGKPVKNADPKGIKVEKKTIDGFSLDPSTAAYKDVAYYPVNYVKAYYNATTTAGKTEKVYLTTADLKANFDLTVSGSKQDAKGDSYVTNTDNYTVTASAKADNTDVVTKNVDSNSNSIKTVNDQTKYFVNDFTGKSEATFTVTGNLPQTIQWNSDKYEKTYNGEPINVRATANTGDAKLTYTDAKGNVLASAPVNAGTYYVTAVAAGNKNFAEATDKRQITIKPMTVSADGLFINNTDKYLGVVEYNGTVQAPVVTTKNGNDVIADLNKVRLDNGKEVTLKPGDFVLSATGKDATVAYDYKVSDGVKGTSRNSGRLADAYKAKLTLQGNYRLVDAAGKETSVDAIYDISQYQLKASDVTVENAEPGKTPVVKVKDGKIPASDYTVTVTNNANVGTGTVTVTGKGQNVVGSVSKDYNVVKKAEVAKTDLYRLYNKNTGEHFFTTNAGEKNNLVKVGWNFEGVSMQTVKDGGKPVYRLYNKNNGGEHLYTTSKGEANKLVSAGWAYEGVAFNAAKNGAEGAVKVYRVYNPNKIANNHHYTTSAGEKNKLVQAGWRDEGVVFYAYNAL